MLTSLLLTQDPSTGPALPPMPWKIEIDPGTSEPWLTQPAATVLASAGVILAAVIAYWTALRSGKQKEKHFQQSHELAEVRGLRDRFTTIAGQLADPSAAVRTAGVYAMEALADDWLQRGQTREVQACINVLCSYLRLPYTLSDRDHHQTKQVIHHRNADREVEEHLEYRQDDGQVRQSIVRTIVAHLRDNALSSWSESDYDFTGAYLEDADFKDAIIRGTVSFRRAQFTGGVTSFANAQFTGGVTSFEKAQFTSADTSFENAQFTGELTFFEKAQFTSAETSFSKAQFNGVWTRFDEALFTSELTSFIAVQFTGAWTPFIGAQFTGARTMFDGARFAGKVACFDRTRFTGELTSFLGARFSGKYAWFVSAEFTGKETSFHGTRFAGEQTSFEKARFSGNRTWFDGAEFTGTKTSFDGAEFTGTKTSFDRAEFTSEQTSFERPAAWQNLHFDWDRDVTLKPATVRPHEWPPTPAR
ncbi:pentapeptide repeat-containing protein [Rhodococcus sp. IEGM 1351]|uniref:pentapeptide repeat-containing protein n=1 Tax=Rhodococcus sp. IEGM 1351 TaxID=3047089 RepID=UPI0024B7B85A|nr:pentapeptide repeat-containing protein [Rhodococcus sp. IEGM 1351]MDI9940366.1 pentapeptide repeat-containing protein [Rhodococcus sp. IEGM 1351]